MPLHDRGQRRPLRECARGHAEQAHPRTAPRLAAVSELLEVENRPAPLARRRSRFERAQENPVKCLRVGAHGHARIRRLRWQFPMQFALQFNYAPRVMRLSGHPDG